MKTAIAAPLLFIFLISSALAENIGHRLGGDYLNFVPENSLIALETSINGWQGATPIIKRPDFAYAELDVYETYDGELVVFHDTKLKRMLPNSGVNAEAYKAIIANVKARTGKVYSANSLRMIHLTLDEIKTLTLKGKYEQKVPTLKEVLDLAEDLQISKPILVEIKDIYTDEGRDALVRLVKDYQDSYGAHAIMDIVPGYDFPGQLPISIFTFKTNFKFSFPDKESRKKYCQSIRQNGLIGIFRPYDHSYNHCKSY